MTCTCPIPPISSPLFPVFQTMHMANRFPAKLKYITATDCSLQLHKQDSILLHQILLRLFSTSTHMIQHHPNNFSYLQPHALALSTYNAVTHILHPSPPPPPRRKKEKRMEFCRLILLTCSLHHESSGVQHTTNYSHKRHQPRSSIAPHPVHPNNQ